MVVVVVMIYSDGVDGYGCGRCGGLQFVGDFGWWWGFLWVMLRIVVRISTLGEEVFIAIEILMSEMLMSCFVSCIMAY